MNTPSERELLERIRRDREMMRTLPYGVLSPAKLLGMMDILLAAIDAKEKELAEEIKERQKWAKSCATLADENERQSTRNRELKNDLEGSMNLSMERKATIARLCEGLERIAAYEISVEAKIARDLLAEVKS